MDQAELQQSLQRISSQFLGTLSESGARAVAGAAEPAVRAELLQRLLLNQSSVLDIVTGPSPEANLLDLLVFARLGTDAVERHLLPVLGETGAPVRDAFAALREDADVLAARVLTPTQSRELDGLVEAWQAAHPEQQRTAVVRLPDFAALAAGTAARAESSRGLLHSVKTATRAADQALLLSERALFLAQRLPFLLRAQVRVTIQEVLRDGTPLVAQGEALVERTTGVVLGRVDAMVKRWLLYAAGGGAALVVLFWAAWLVARALAAP